MSSKAANTPAKATNLTDQQTAAITTRNVSVSLSAGAGCGKTFVLTRRFLSHLEPGPDTNLSGLAAITFTERAAREMRERIRAECFQRLKNCAESEVEHWLQVTREIDAARVSTIHSFCASILRSSAVEAELDPQFGLMDPNIGAAFLRNAVTEAVHGSVASQHSFALDMVHEFGLDRTVSLCESLVRQRFQLNRSLWRNQTPEQLAAFWKDRFQQVAPAMGLQTLAADPSVQNLLELLEHNVPDNATMQARRAVLLSELPRLKGGMSAIPNPVTWMTELRENAQIKGGGTKKVWADEATYEAVKDNLTDLRTAIDKASECLEFVEEDIVVAARLSLQALELVTLAIDQYELRKSEAAVLDFDDLLLRTRDLLRDNEAVRKRVAAGIDFLLVDEFQDTDPIQAEIVRAICGTRLTTGKLFLVGDAQQSIYRFRRADPAVFHRLRMEIPEAGRLPLNKNFRSQPAILNFVNALFVGTLGEIFQKLEPAVAQMSPDPSIEFLFAAPQNPEEGDSAEARKQLEATWMARRLRELLADPTPRIRYRDPATGQHALRTVLPGDIVILFRALTDVRHYEQALRDCQLEYYLVGGKAFYAQQEVFDLLNLLRCLNEPDDDVSLLGALRSPFFGLSDDTLMSLVRHGRSLRAALSLPPPGEITEVQQQLVIHAAAVLHEFHESKDRLPIAGLIQLILEHTAYDASLLTEFLGRRKLANLRKLIEMARQFDQAGGFTLADFVERLKGSVSEETDEELAATQAETSNVIRLMTIHQSKGLEFPVVVVADMDRSGKPPGSTAELHTELGPLVAPPERFGRRVEHLGLRLFRLLENEAEAEEHMRLLYVALTRAADHLILSAGLKSPDKVQSGWMTLLAKRFDLATGCPVLNPQTGQAVIPAPYDATCPAILSHRVPPRSPLLVPGVKAILPLKDFAETVSQSEALPLPALVAPLAADRTLRRVFSVSDLETIDERLAHPATVSATSAEAAVQPPPNPPNSEELGHLVHGVLEKFDPQGDESQIANLVESLGSTTLSVITDDMRQLATNMLLAFMRSDLPQQLASARQCFREIDFQIVVPAELLSVSAPVKVVSGQIDCLFQTREGDWVILDYKTGDRFAGQDPQKLLDHYDFQLGVYAWAIQDWFGIPPARVAIITFRPKIAVTEWQVTAEAIEDIQERVKKSVAYASGLCGNSLRLQ
jgi:ATP-dependent helicase/nuclease subunit A